MLLLWYCLFPSHSATSPVLEITPLKVDQFAWELRHHPNRQVCNFVLDGLRNGFKLGFQPTLSLKSAKKNKSSAYQQPLVIDEYLAHEVPWGRVVGPFRSPPQQLWGYSQRRSAWEVAFDSGPLIPRWCKLQSWDQRPWVYLALCTYQC